MENLYTQLRARQDQFCFRPVWSQLFGWLLEVLRNQRTLSAFWHELHALGEAPEADPYRQYFGGLWKTRQHDWGVPPQ